MRPVIHRLGGFTATVLVSSIVGVIAIPALIATVGAGAWGHLVVVQSVCQVVAILVGFGWVTVGPSMIATTEPAARAHLYQTALIARAWLFLPGLAVTVLVLVAVGIDLPLAVVGGVAYLLPSLGASWFFIGEGSPRRLLLLDQGPFMLGTVAGMVAAALSSQIVAFAAWQAAGALLGAVIGGLVALRTGPRGRPELSPIHQLRTLSGQLPAVTAAAVSTLYVNLPIVAIQLLVPALLPVYALADRLFRYASVAFSPVQQFFQGWVPEAGAHEVPRRSVRAIAAAAGIGVLGGICVAALSGPAAALLSHGRIVVGPELSIPLGTAFIAIAVSAVTGYACLVAVGRTRMLAVSNVAGAVLGAPIILLCAAAGSLPGVAWAVTASEFVVAVVQLVDLRRTIRRDDVARPAERPSPR